MRSALLGTSPSDRCVRGKSGGRKHLSGIHALCRNWHRRRRHLFRQPGCRGFTGPVPPPLWMTGSQRMQLFR